MTMWTDKPLIPDHKRNADREMVKLGLETSDFTEKPLAFPEILGKRLRRFP